MAPRLRRPSRGRRTDGRSRRGVGCRAWRNFLCRARPARRAPPGHGAKKNAARAASLPCNGRADSSAGSGGLPSRSRCITAAFRCFRVALAGSRGAAGAHAPRTAGNYTRGMAASARPGRFGRRSLSRTQHSGRRDGRQRAAAADRATLQGSSAGSSEFPCPCNPCRESDARRDNDEPTSRLRCLCWAQASCGSCSCSISRSGRSHPNRRRRVSTSSSNLLAYGCFMFWFANAGAHAQRSMALALGLREWASDRVPAGTHRPIVSLSRRHGGQRRGRVGRWLARHPAPDLLCLIEARVPPRWR